MSPFPLALMLVVGLAVVTVGPSEAQSNTSQSRTPATTRARTATTAPRTTPAATTPVRRPSTPAPTSGYAPTNTNQGSPASALPNYQLPGLGGQTGMGTPAVPNVAPQAPDYRVILGPSSLGGYSGDGRPVLGGIQTPQDQQPAGNVAAPRGIVYAPGGPQVQRFGAAAPPVRVVAPPRSVFPGPRGTHKLQSLSGERLYLDGGLRVRPAGIVYPRGELANRTRATIKDTVLTMPLWVIPEAGSPPKGDANFRAWLYLPDGRSLSAELVARGVAAVSQSASFRTTEEKQWILAAEAEARKKGLGIWRR